MATSTTYNRAFWNVMKGKEENNQNLSEGFDNVGAYVAPDEFREGFNTALAKENIFRRFATVINLSSAEGKIQAVSSTGTADWVEDGDPIPESADTFTQFLVKSYKLASLVKLNRSFVTDMNFNLEKYLMGDFAKRFGKAEENALLNGNGTTQPTGILTADADVTTADSATISFDEIISLYFSLKEACELALNRIADEVNKCPGCKGLNGPLPKYPEAGKNFAIYATMDTTLR